MQMQNDEHAFSAEGTVVDILERGGERFATIAISPSTVLEVATASLELSPGDRVIVDAALNVTHVRRGAADSLPGSPPRHHDEMDGQRHDSVRPTLRDYQHVLRMAVVFAAGLAAFLLWRSWMVPADFGTLGHFRANAIVEAAERTPRFAGQASCMSCHEDAQRVRATSSHATVSCEACHGPLGEHARGASDVAPIRPSTRATCLSCHTSRVGVPAAFPRIIPREHSEAGPCTDCHTAHAPGLS
jgi:hypothetical protein